MKEDTILNIDSVFIDFLHGRTDKNFDEEVVERNITIDVKQGIVTALIGGNGSGKTTLFNIISGFLKASSGEIYYKRNNVVSPISDLPPYKIARLGLGRMFQDNHIFHDMTVVDNMLVADEKLFGENPVEPFLFFSKCNKIERERIKEVFERFHSLFGENSELLKKLNEKASSLSYGQQRLLGLSRLLMGDYSMLLLDEPTSGVSPQHIEDVRRLVRLFVENEGKTVFLIEHNMQFVLDTADYCYFIDDGLIKYKGKPADVLSIPEVRMDYLGV